MQLTHNFFFSSTLQKTKTAEIKPIPPPSKSNNHKSFSSLSLSTPPGSPSLSPPPSPPNSPSTSFTNSYSVFGEEGGLGGKGRKKEEYTQLDFLEAVVCHGKMDFKGVLEERGSGGKGEVVKMENEWVTEMYSSALVLEEDVSGHPVIDEQRYDWIMSHFEKVPHCIYLVWDYNSAPVFLVTSTKIGSSDGMGFFFFFIIFII